MKIGIKHILYFFSLFYCLSPVWAWGANYIVSASTSTVDGDTFCGGSACKSSDTIIIEGGARGDLFLRDFDGNRDGKGLYITIQNEETNRVVITHDGAAGNGILSFYNCKYIDFRGDKNSSFAWSEGCKSSECYGIKVINDGTPRTPVKNIWVYGKSDHIKLGYIESEHTSGAKGYASVGIGVGDASLTNSWTFDTFEIHHNYIHDTRYAGMYLGHNYPHKVSNCAGGCPYTANFNVHHNLIEDVGSYGGNIKGINGGINYFQNNIIKRTGKNCVGGNCADSSKDGMRSGFKFLYTYGINYITISGNWIENTAGPCLKVWEADHLVYDNILLGCGQNIDTNLGNGINIDDSDWMPNRLDQTVQLFNNIIVESTEYAIYAKYSTSKGYMYENIIAEAGRGEHNINSALTEGAGDKANIFENDADDAGFEVWIDDGDYSNDKFTLINSNPAAVLGFRLSK